MPKTSLTFLSTALVAASDESYLRIDRECLHQAGFQRVHTRVEGRAALRALLDRPYDVVLCDRRLSDMTGLEFVSLVDDVVMSNRPSLITTGEENRDERVLEAVEAGGAVYMPRPYSMGDMHRQLKLADKLARLDACQRTRLVQAGRERLSNGGESDFEERKAPPVNFEGLFRKGVAFLEQRKYDEAVAAFQEASVNPALAGKCREGAAKAWLGKGDRVKYREFMLQAAEAYILRQEHRKARRLMTELSSMLPAGKNPFHELGFRMVRSGDFQSAARIYSQTDSVHTGESGVFSSMARACHFTADPENTAKRLADALSFHQGMPKSTDIFLRIMGKHRPGSAPVGVVAPKTGMLPAGMSDVWSVLKFTVDTFKNGGPMPPSDSEQERESLNASGVDPLWAVN